MSYLDHTPPLEIRAHARHLPGRVRTAPMKDLKSASVPSGRVTSGKVTTLWFSRWRKVGDSSSPPNTTHSFSLNAHTSSSPVPFLHGELLALVHQY
jgi:hypothetical protein